MKKPTEFKLWAVALLVGVMGFLPLVSTYYATLAWWLIVLEPVLGGLAMWLFNRALDEHINYFTTQGAKRYRNRKGP